MSIAYVASNWLIRQKISRVSVIFRVSNNKYKTIRKPNLDCQLDNNHNQNHRYFNLRPNTNFDAV